MNTPIISISNLTKSYGNHSILDQLNWDVEQGDIVALLGKNGAGKSTLLETIMKLRNPDQGTINVWGRSWDELPQEKKESVGFVAQDIKGYEWMSVKSFLEFLGGFFPTWNREYCDQLRNKWGLPENKRVGDLSGGQSQILHVIHALSIRPELLVLDEPVAHLDPSMRRQFLKELIELSCEIGSTVIFSSHIVSDLERVANKVALLKDGKIEHYHEVEQLKHAIAHVKISANHPIEQAPHFSEMINWQSRHDGATATIAAPLERSLEQLAKETGVTIESLPMSLEDWYLEVNHAAD